MKYEDLKSEYTHLWQTMSIRPSKLKVVKGSAQRILDNKDRYQAIEAITGVPWFFVGVVHKMECNCNFSLHLHNGDSLTRRTRRVPSGRPKDGKPPFTWEVSAADALNMKKLSGIADWSVERICYQLEAYNGWGYRKYHPSTLSPYLWSFTDHYRAGKYVSDGKWSSTAVSAQSGAMALLKCLVTLDKSIQLHMEGDAIDEPGVDENEILPPAEPKPVADAVKNSRTIFGVIVAAFASVAQLFRDGIELALDAATRLDAIQPVKGVFSGLGINMGTTLFALTVAALGLALYARLDDARKGRVIK